MRESIGAVERAVRFVFGVRGLFGGRIMDFGGVVRWETSYTAGHGGVLF